MKRIICFLIFSFTFCTEHVFAQTDSRSDSIHIIKYDISLAIRNFSATSISAETSITLVPKVNAITYLRLDLLKFTISSITINGDSQPFYRNDSVVYISLKQPKNNGDTFVLRIAYSGHPQTDPKWGGFYFNGTNAYNMGVGFVVNPHNFGRCWFPCFDNFTERSLFDYHITTDSGYKAICGGLLKSSSTNIDNSVVWNWSITTPIPTYLASVSVSNYEFLQSVYSSVVQNKDIPIIIASHAIDTQNVKKSFSHLPQTLNLFEDKFGPFKFERVGYNLVPFTMGAMEHACNITYPQFAADGSTGYENLWVHELSHHWWGDLATCQSAGDMWLNEGWAVYSEKLFYEKVYGWQSYMNEVKANHLNVLRYAHIIDGDFRAVAGVPHQYTYGEHVYHKGADVIHTLRTYMSDSSFFAACHQHLSNFSLKSVTTNDRKIDFQNTTNADLNSYFNDWILKKGFCDFRIKSLSTDSGLTSTIVIVQELRAANGYYTNVPLTVSFYDKNWNSVTKSFLMSGAIKILNYQLDFVPVMAVIDMDEKISFARTKNTDILKSKGLKVYPDGLLNVTVTSITDSAFIHIEHHWTSPDRGMCLIPGLYLSNYRYWKVDGIWPTNFNADAMFYYDGTTPSNFNNGYLDHTFIKNTEDSLFLVWRPDGNSYWQLVPDSIAVKKMGSSLFDKIGWFNVKNLKKGEYAFAMYNKALAGVNDLNGSNQNINDQLQVYPNPSKDLIKVALDFAHQDGMIMLMNLQGEIVLSIACSTLLSSIEIDVSIIPKGFYFMHYSDGLLSVNKKIVLE